MYVEICAIKNFLVCLSSMSLLSCRYVYSDWCGVKLTEDSGALLETTEALLDSDTDLSKFEPVSQDLHRQAEEGRCVKIRNLRRVFETTAEDRVAVKNLTMDIYEGQCTVLLGHNGAGIVEPCFSSAGKRFVTFVLSYRKVYDYQHADWPHSSYLWRRHY